ncbi:hypothetical protein N7513_006920 [Penicillium frequentans]|uniref:Uncharacterized protein n=1 Tax=Penicillium frequentans TaxID=3151616 RepID=A0AAD6GKL9_9EURO|nr:hypothetical protein N7513_006920 [Penicillium glabrum]KAJ5553738.1 hypothetical protein N7494_003116 [Penicillium glabrum]
MAVKRDQQIGSWRGVSTGASDVPSGQKAPKVATFCFMTQTALGANCLGDRSQWSTMNAPEAPHPPEGDW